VDFCAQPEPEKGRKVGHEEEMHGKKPGHAV
jgi:hypothetical protein